MADESVIIRRADTGGEVSVVESEFRKHYPDVAYEVIGQETAEAFTLVGVPVPRPPRRKPRDKAKGPAATPLATADE